MLFELKSYLGIEHNDSDLTLSLHLNASQKYFNRICGDNIDFEDNEDYKELLFERCRYADANALELFEVNFKSDLVRMIMQVAVRKSARSKSIKETSKKEI